MALTRKIDKEILNRLVLWMEKNKSSPVRIVLLPTNRCNLRCVFCGGVYERKDPNFSWKDELDRKKWIEIAEEANDLGVVEWLIGGGGEPMVRAETVVEMIKKIKQLNSNSVIELSTNGTLITKDIAKKLVLSGCDFIQTGIDGPNAKIHDFLRGRKGAFKRTVKAIKYLSSAKKKYKKEKPTIKVHVVLNSKNYDKLLKMLKLIYSLGANFFAVAAMRVYGGGQEKTVNKVKIRMNNLQKREVHKIWKEVEKLAYKLNIQLGPAFYEGLEEVSESIEHKEPMKFQDSCTNHFLSAFCFAPFYGFIVDWVGNVGPCPCAGSVRDTGNNLQTKSLKEIWYGKFLTSVREYMLQGKTMELENLFPGKDLKGLPLHPCESCGINVERQEIVERLSRIIKGESVLK